MDKLVLKFRPGGFFSNMKRLPDDPDLYYNPYDHHIYKKSWFGGYKHVGEADEYTRRFYDPDYAKIKSAKEIDEVLKSSGLRRYTSNGVPVVEKFFNKQRYTSNGVPIVEKFSNRTSNSSNKPIDNYFLKGFENRKSELSKLGKSVRNIQKMLGFSGKNLDGKWGLNTENAYKEYLAKNAAKFTPLAESIPVSIEQTYTPSNIPTEEEFKPRRISFSKKGGLISRNPVLRFKNK